MLNFHEGIEMHFQYKKMLLLHAMVFEEESCLRKHIQCG
jgi:hypothetical protein